VFADDYDTDTGKSGDKDGAGTVVTGFNIEPLLLIAVAVYAAPLFVRL